MWAKQLLEKEVMGIVPRLLSRSQEGQEGQDSTLAETASLGAVFVQRGWRKKNGRKRLQAWATELFGCLCTLCSMKRKKAMG